jgi:hypothetical protein
MNDHIERHIVKNRKSIAQFSAVAAVAYGFITARLILQNEKTIRQAEYLASIVQKNIEHLDEFDIIALTDLGLIKTKTEE